MGLLHNLYLKNTYNWLFPVCSGISRSLESVVAGNGPRSQTTVAVRVDQHGRLIPPVRGANSVLMQTDPRRFSEASIVPPPRPPPPRMNVRSQRRPVAHPVPPTMWPPQVAAQAQPQPPGQQPALQQGLGGSNLVKMSHMARSTPQLDDGREARTRIQSGRDSVISQVRQGDIWAFAINLFCGPHGGGRFYSQGSLHALPVSAGFPQCSPCVYWVLSMFYLYLLSSPHVLLSCLLRSIHVLQLLPQSKNMHVRWLENSNLSAGVWVLVCL